MFSKSTVLAILLLIAAATLLTSSIFNVIAANRLEHCMH